MATIPITLPPGDMPAELEEAIAALKAAGHDVLLIEPDAAESSGDPFLNVDLDTVPASIWTALGISRQEVERHREARPAVEHGRTTVAEPAPTA